jgi:hypothetical protein
MFYAIGLKAKQRHLIRQGCHNVYRQHSHLWFGFSGIPNGYLNPPRILLADLQTENDLECVSVYDNFNQTLSKVAP